MLFGLISVFKKRLEQNTGCEVTLYEDQVKAFFHFFNLNLKMKKLIRIFIFVIAGLIILTCINYGYTAWSIHHWKNVLEQSSFEQLKK